MGSYGAGILAISESTGRALVLLRSALVSEPLTWAPPGGGDEPFDDGSVRWTGVREFIEETGHRPSGRILPLAVVQNDTGPYHQFVLLEQDEFVPQLDWENAGAMWLTFEELLGLPGKHPEFEDLLANSVVQRDLYTLMEGIS